MTETSIHVGANRLIGRLLDIDGGAEAEWRNATAEDVDPIGLFIRWTYGKHEIRQFVPWHAVRSITIKEPQE